MSNLFRNDSSFQGGLILDEHKEESNRKPIRQTKLPLRLTLSLQQHIGHVAECIVSVGDKVLKGQILAKATDYISANVHAPSSGVIKEVNNLSVPHPSGLKAPCIVIETDGFDTWAELPEPIDFLYADSDELRERIRWAGIVGLGGAVFPTNVKTNTTGKEIKSLEINAAE